MLRMQRSQTNCREFPELYLFISAFCEEGKIKFAHSKEGIFRVKAQPPLLCEGRKCQRILILPAHTGQNYEMPHYTHPCVLYKV
jgi:hypothetical protein